MLVTDPVAQFKDEEVDNLLAPGFAQEPGVVLVGPARQVRPASVHHEKVGQRRDLPAVAELDREPADGEVARPGRGFATR